MSTFFFNKDAPKAVKPEPEKFEHIKIELKDSSIYTFVLHQEYDDNPDQWGTFIIIVDENEGEHYFPADQIKSMFIEMRVKYE